VAGWQPVVRLLPDPGTPLLLATVRLDGPYAAGDTERELRAAIEKRHTSRQPFSSQPVPPGVLAELTDAATLEGAILHILDHNEAVRVLHLASDAERAQRADPAYQEELARWAGGPRDRDGIPDSALGPRSPDSLTPVRDFTPRTTTGAGGQPKREPARLGVSAAGHAGRRRSRRDAHATAARHGRPASRRPRRHAQAPKPGAGMGAGAATGLLAW
jgi:hypothetical protein